MKFEILEPGLKRGENNLVATKITKKRKKTSSDEIIFDDGSCGCCCSGNSDANPDKRCSVCEDCTHVAECEEVYFYGRCVCGKGKEA